MSYELFQQDPTTYVSILLVSLIITLVAYSAFPLIFAMARKRPITKKKYGILCFLFNFLVMVMFIVINDSSSGGPYLLWTCVFSALGTNTLKSRGILEEAHSIAASKTPVRHPNRAIDSAISKSDEKPKIRFCRKCGHELTANSNFCSKCGTDIIKEDNYELS